MRKRTLHESASLQRQATAPPPVCTARNTVRSAARTRKLRRVAGCMHCCSRAHLAAPRLFLVTAAKLGLVNLGPSLLAGLLASAEPGGWRVQCNASTQYPVKGITCHHFGDDALGCVATHLTGNTGLQGQQQEKACAERVYRAVHNVKLPAQHGRRRNALVAEYLRGTATCSSSNARALRWHDALLPAI